MGEMIILPREEFRSDSPALVMSAYGLTALASHRPAGAWNQGRHTGETAGALNIPPTLILRDIFWPSLTVS